MADTDTQNEQPAGKTHQIEKDGAAAKAAGPATPIATAVDSGSGDQSDRMEFILDIPLEISVELGRTRMVINDLLKLGQGSVIELDKIAGETLEILANQRLVAKGEVVMVNEKYGVRLTEVISPLERLERLT